jgi:hypothetical protein
MSRIRKKLKKFKKEIIYKLNKKFGFNLNYRIKISFYKSIKLGIASSPSTLCLFNIGLKISRERNLALNFVLSRMIIFLLIGGSSICTIESFLTEIFYNHGILTIQIFNKFIKRIYKNTINILAFPLTGTIYIFNQTLVSFEIIVFGQPLPIYPYGPFLFY